jgi:hypothetical protein
MSEHDDIRRRTRVQGRFRGTLVFENDREPPTMGMSTRNISLKGLLCETDEPLEPSDAGSDCRVVIDLSEADRIDLRARVVRSQEREAALDFLAMDPDSYAHLRNVVRYAADDPDAIDREQAEPAFGPRNDGA